MVLVPLNENHHHVLQYLYYQFFILGPLILTHVHRTSWSKNRKTKGKVLLFETSVWVIICFWNFIFGILRCESKSQVSQGVVRLKTGKKMNYYNHEYDLAVLLQKRWRGIMARTRARIMRYENYQSAALTIQWAYRAYRVIELSRRRTAVGGDLSASKMAVGVLPVAAENKERWKRLLAGDASFQEKTDMWRNIVELRRAHGYSTDVCVKALLHSDGDLTRAISIIGNPDFNFRYGSDKLPNDVYSMFFPTISRPSKHGIVDHLGNVGASTSKFRLTVSMNKKRRRREIKAHKKLAEHLHAAQSVKSYAGLEEPEDAEESALIDLAEVMWRTYLVQDRRTQYSGMR